MYARITTLKGRPDKLDEGIRFFTEIGGRLQQIEGYKGGWMFVNRQSNKVITIALWESEAASTAYANSPLRQEVVSRLADLVTEEPTVEVYEVAGQP